MTEAATNGAVMGAHAASPYAGAGRILDPQDPALLALATLRPARVWGDIARCYALIGAAWAVLALAEPWWAFAVPCFLLIGTQQYALATLVHDGRHGRLLRRREANHRLARFVLGAPVLHDLHYAAEGALHMAHHRTVGTAADPERHLYVATGKATRSAFLLYLTGLPAVPTVLAKMLYRSASSRGARRPMRSFDGAIPMVVAQLLIVALVSAVTPWWYYVAFWLGPIYVCVFVPKKIRVLCEHGQPLLPDEAADTRRLITFVPNAIERWLFAPMNMQYHAEHHLWPFVPYYNLPALHRLAGDTPAIEVRRSYVGYLRAYFRRLPLAAP